MTRRWNGWGNPAQTYPLPPSAEAYLKEKIGQLTATPDTGLAEVVAGVPSTWLPAHPLVTADPEQRLLHARGQSLPDWIALRTGHIGAFPDGVAHPASSGDVRDLFAYAQRSGARIIPYGGGTSVVGHINPRPGDAPVLTLSLARLNQLTRFDENSRLATFGAGVTGPALEKQLNARGCTLGHFPQSFELSTLGGWVATRSSGQQSYHYGRIEDLFAGGHLETPRGPLPLPALPASAAGPDLRHTVLGSEGRLGVITEATVRVRPLPEAEGFYGVFFRTWEAGVAAVREIAQSGLLVSMLRLSDAQETETTLILSGKEDLVRWADRGLRALNYEAGRCLLIFGVTGARRTAAQTRRRVHAVCRAHGGLPTGAAIGNLWRKSRFRSPYLRNTLWERGVALDTFETAVPWENVFSTAAAMKTAITNAAADAGERVLVFAHLSHVYRDGASIYVTYLFRRTANPDELLARWQRMKAFGSQAIVEQGGTISHQHGVGADHAPYLPAEKGALGMDLLRAAHTALDPAGMMNPGKLVDSR